MWTKDIVWNTNFHYFQFAVQTQAFFLFQFRFFMTNSNHFENDRCHLSSKFSPSRNSSNKILIHMRRIPWFHPLNLLIRNWLVEGDKTQCDLESKILVSWKHYETLILHNHWTLLDLRCLYSMKCMICKWTSEDDVDEMRSLS